MPHFEEKKKTMAVWQKRIYENLKCLILRRKKHGCLTENNLWKPEMPHFEEKKTWLSDRKQSMKTWNASFWGEKNMAVWQKKIYENLKCLILRRKKKPMAVWQKRIYENLKCLILRRKKNMAAWQKRIYENLKCLILRRKKKTWLPDRKESMKTWNASFWGEKKNMAVWQKRIYENLKCLILRRRKTTKTDTIYKLTLLLWGNVHLFQTGTLEGMSSIHYKHTHTHTHTHTPHTHHTHTHAYTHKDWIPALETRTNYCNDPKHPLGWRTDRIKPS